MRQINAYNEVKTAIKKKLFIKNAALMTFSALLIRCMAMVFRVYLADVIGAEGVGLYQLIMSIYLFFASVSTAGVTLCATRLFGDLYAQGNYGQARYSIERCIVISLISGAAVSLVMFLTADLSAGLLLHESRAAPALRLLSPSLPFMAASACIRGYFTSRRKTLPTCIEQLLEQIIEMGILAAAFSFNTPQDTGQVCCRAVIGTSAAELVSFVYSLLCYRSDIKKLGCKREHTPSLIRKMLPIALPVTANACLRSGLSTAENALIPLGLQRYGMSSELALTKYGIISGMSMTVLVFPSVLILPFAVLIIPEIAEAAVLRHKNEVRYISGRMFGLTMMYAVPVTVLLMFYAVPICRLLFGSDEAGIYLSMLAPVIPFMYLDSVTDGILKGLNEQTSYLIFNTADSVLRVILTYTLLPFFGIYGVIAVIIISELINTLMSIARLVHITEFRVSLAEYLLRPCCCMLLPCLLLRLFSLGAAAEIAIAVSLCLMLLWLTRKKPGASVG